MPIPNSILRGFKTDVATRYNIPELLNAEWMDCDPPHSCYFSISSLRVQPQGQMASIAKELSVELTLSMVSNGMIRYEIKLNYIHHRESSNGNTQRGLIIFHGNPHNNEKQYKGFLDDNTINDVSDMIDIMRNYKHD